MCGSPEVDAKHKCLARAAAKALPVVGAEPLEDVVDCHLLLLKEAEES